MCVCLKLVVYRIEMQHQEPDRHVLFPSDANHEMLQQHVATPTATLVELLALTDRVEEHKLVQVLSEVESLQIKFARLKMLNKEEERVTEVMEEIALLKTDPVKARLAPAIAELSTAITRFSAFIANIPSDELSSKSFAPYKFEDMARQAAALHESEKIRALDRWHTALDAVCQQLRKVLPKDWRPKTIAEYDVEYVASRILVQSLITGLGSDYVSASTWLAGLQEIESVWDAYKTRHEKSVDSITETLKDTRDIVSCILGYNMMLYKWPKVSATERRQQLKDLRKKLKGKLGKKYDMPEGMANRLQANVAK